MVSTNEESPCLRKERFEMEKLLSGMSQNGVELMLDNQLSTPGTIADKAVREDSRYMADFCFSEEGELIGVYFDEV